MCDYDYCMYTAYGCDELLKSLLQAEVEEHPFPGIYFQGDAIVAKKIVCFADLNGGMIIHSKRLGRTFIVGPDRSGWFLLCLYGETVDTGITIGVDVPSYCRDEMICTIKNDWNSWE